MSRQQLGIAATSCSPSERCWLRQKAPESGRYRAAGIGGCLVVGVCSASLAAHAAGEGRAPGDGAECERVRALVARRANREPLQYLLGTQEFCGREFRVTPCCPYSSPGECLIGSRGDPSVRAESRRDSGGCGNWVRLSGCVCGIGPADARVLAIDASADALAVARANMEQHGRRCTN